MSPDDTPRLSVVIPTRNRCELLVRCLDSLACQSLSVGDFEVIVVDDGSTDATSKLAASYEAPYRIVWCAIDHSGLSSARNHANRIARGSIILCLDDDMIAAPDLLAEHVAAHEGSSRTLVQGALMLHDSLPRTPYVSYEERLLDAYRREKSVPETTLDSEDVYGGNMSLSRALLDAIGGFDERLERNTDGELAYRAVENGAMLVYRPLALASMTHVNDLAAAVRASFKYGQSYVRMQATHPRTRWRLSPFVTDPSPSLRWLGRRLVYARAQHDADAAWLQRATAVGTWLAERLRLPRIAGALYRLALDHAFFRGVAAESESVDSFVPRPIPILCYHSVSSVVRRKFRRYILPPPRFESQMRWMKRCGYEAITLSRLLDYLEGVGQLPSKPVVITFDDGYAELARTATPLLAGLGYAHTHFINTGKLGGTTDWVEFADDLPILDSAVIARLSRDYPEVVDFQAHGRDHRSFEGLPRDLGRREIEHCIEVLQPLTGRAVEFVAYPFGDYDRATPGLMRSLSVRAAFTVDRGLCRPGQDPHLLPRVEVFTSDSQLDFACKLRFGWGPIASLRIHVGRPLEAVMAVMRSRRWQRA